MKAIITIIILFLLSNTAFSQVILIGPTYHYNFGGDSHKSSFGFEVSYWNWEVLDDIVPVGFDMGVEFEKGKIRVYSEFQGGIIYGGSVGYVHEFTKEYNKGGFQGSAWGAFFGGLEMRVRRINNTNFFSPGIFIKAPILLKQPHFC